VPELDAAGIDLENDDLFIHPVTKDTQLMRGEIPWKGAREKDPLFLQMFIESTTAVGDIVLNCIASTGMNSPVYFSLQSYGLLASMWLLIFFTLLAGASIHACRKAGRHIVAM
jgi:hypothetical protein